MKTLSNGLGACPALLFAGACSFLFLMTPVTVLSQDEQAPAVPAAPDAEGSSKGVILIAAKEGTTKFSMNGKVLPDDSTKANAALSEGALIETGADGSGSLADGHRIDRCHAVTNRAAVICRPTSPRTR